MTTQEQEETPAEELHEDALPEHVTEEPNGDWVYRVQHPFERQKDTDPEKIRIPKTIYVRHFRTIPNGSSQVDVVFHLASTMSGVGKDVIDRMDLRDYSVVSNLVARRTVDLPT